MDFSLSEEQRELRDLVTRILGDRVTPERLAALDTQGEWLDRELWQDLARAGVLGAALPEEVGGEGASFLELHLVLEAVGAAVAHLPVWPTLVLGALPVAEFGTAQQRRRFLVPVAKGESVLTAALADLPDSEVSARRVDGGYEVSGIAHGVPVAQLADRILVPATVSGSDEVVVVLVDPARTRLHPQETVSGQPQADVELRGVTVPADEVLAGASPSWMLQHAWAGLASLQAGVCGRALRMAADYASAREQFGRPIASFQAVGQRMADAYIDAEGIRMTALSAAWRLSAGLPADDEVAIAKWWAAEGGHRVVHAAQHVHGGVGVDLDYPLHRYFLAAKEIEFTLGGATQQLLRLGGRLARA